MIRVETVVAELLRKVHAVATMHWLNVSTETLDRQDRQPITRGEAYLIANGLANVTLKLGSVIRRLIDTGMQCAISEGAGD